MYKHLLFRRRDEREQVHDQLLPQLQALDEAAKEGAEVLVESTDFARDAEYIFLGRIAREGIQFEPSARVGLNITGAKIRKAAQLYNDGIIEVIDEPTFVRLADLGHAGNKQLPSVSNEGEGLIIGQQELEKLLVNSLNSTRRLLFIGSLLAGIELGIDCPYTMEEFATMRSEVLNGIDSQARHIL